LPVANAILALAVAMVEPPLGALLIAAIGGAALLDAGLIAAVRAAVTLAAVAVAANEKHRAAVSAAAKPLPENNFSSNRRRHARGQAAALLDNLIPSWHARTSW
jgi:hypothetical protein